MQIKTTMRYHLTLVRMAIIKKTINKCWQGHEKRETSGTVGGMQTGAATVENSMKIPQKLNIELPYDPAIPLLDIYPTKIKTLIRQDICTLHVHFSITYNGQDKEAT